MTKAALITALMLAGAPALAQTAQPAGPPDVAAPTTPPASEQTPAPSTTTTPTPEQPVPTTTTTTPTDQSAPGTAAPTTSETNSTAADTQASTTASSDPIAATVSADWAKYDANSNKNLNRAEFNKWIGDLQAAAEKKAPTRAYLSNAFRKADGDKSGTVSQDELTAFLKG
ncbi:MAG: hypothetical protein AVDCRST_MAG09-337 [uncultured Sphingomonas sp.]|uniref:EF-hand domain-containing protein n=1 Tax=uncultured Sphingomonas sp. TaxID=158754 RepID=A0A6J4SFV4_9SPHN|nr:hypothetical protein [uncultured Sphingomonas sp.]CAA9494789.1 MAG: hypothetical protein AVDCRST_MAG09-337 [uncultured Sphingomonas sp.]